MCGKAPKIPPPPPPTAQETALLEKQSKVLDLYIKSVEEQKVQNKELALVQAISSGLYDPVYDQSGKLLDARLNPARVAEMQEDFSRNEEVRSLALDRYERALKGELPVSEALIQRKAKDFSLLQERAARQGAPIVGATLEEASTTPQGSTAANELVGNISRTYALLEDSERRGELSMGAPQALGVQPLQIAAGTQEFGPGAVAPGYSSVLTQFPGVLDPLRRDREMEYNRAVQNAALRSQRDAAIYGAVGQGIGMGATAILK